MLRLARWHAPDTCARAPPFTASCRPVACSTQYFRTPSTRPTRLPAPSDLALYLSMARSPLLKTHSLRPARRTRQRLTSHDFIESARRSIPAFVPGCIPPGPSDKDLASTGSNPETMPKDRQTLWRLLKTIRGNLGAISRMHSINSRLLTGMCWRLVDDASYANKLQQ
jgi:hypothetical protein